MTTSPGHCRRQWRRSGTAAIGVQSADHQRNVHVESAASSGSLVADDDNNSDNDDDKDIAWTTHGGGQLSRVIDVTSVPVSLCLTAPLPTPDSATSSFFRSSDNRPPRGSGHWRRGWRSLPSRSLPRVLTHCRMALGDGRSHGPRAASSPADQSQHALSP